MTDPEQIARVMVETPPRVPLTRRQVMWRTLAVFFAAVGTLALVLSLVNIFQTASLATCTNNVLGFRNAPATAVSSAQIQVARADHAYNDAEKALYTALAKQEPIHAQTHLFAVLRATQARKDAAQTVYLQAVVKQHREQLAHPIGKC